MIANVWFVLGIKETGLYVWLYYCVPNICLERLIYILNYVLSDVYKLY